MKQSTVIFALVAFISQVYTAPQFINFSKEGTLGVNFGGYHAGVGLGGLAGGAGAGGLFAEAGTPFGQEASAGLGGAYDSEGKAAGGLYAGATAGGNVKAAAGLAGGASGGGAAGGAYAGAQAGGHKSQAGLAGESSSAGSAGFSFSASKSFGASNGGIVDVVKETEVVEHPVQIETVHPVFIERTNTVQPPTNTGSITKQRKVHKVYEEESVNYVNDVPPPTVVKTVDVRVQAPVTKAVEIQKTVEVKAEAPVVYKEVYVPAPVVEKTVVHRYKPRHHHKTAWLGGYIGAGGAVAPPPQRTRVVYQEVPVIQRRVEYEAESAADLGAAAAVGVDNGANYGYRKTVNFTAQRNPTFFSDIFNIPIQTLSAVGKFLGNAAGGTSLSVEKTASIHAGY